MPCYVTDMPPGSEARIHQAWLAKDCVPIPAVSLCKACTSATVIYNDKHLMLLQMGHIITQAPGVMLVAVPTHQCLPLYYHPHHEQTAIYGSHGWLGRSLCCGITVDHSRWNWGCTPTCQSVWDVHTNWLVSISQFHYTSLCRLMHQ